MSMIGLFLAVPQAELGALRAEPEEIEEFLSGPRGDDAFCVDKSWHAIHYLLTGSTVPVPGPLSNVVFGVGPLGNLDLGYGPPLCTDAADVKTIAAALEAVSDDAVQARFDPAAMDEVYPSFWDEEDALPIVMEALGELRAFYREAAAQGYAVITWLA
ncbi:YfbM family protein [Pseudoduganella chitinolytica]|uniref:YfbM family protein n=1 Tax=Pseudoduganella chitinolytica TaxID=34070 RepID=A0ABY8B7K5_9BURK|nr:YfbM family protein [Pseudoduganella chitinolytica]WEF31922.1 YfbM family protein [Pseudoduganella chitinolytica]